MEGAWDTFWIRSQDSTSNKDLWPQKLGWLCPVSPALNNPTHELKNYFCFWCRLIPRKSGKQNYIERAHFFKVQSGKRTVCNGSFTYVINLIILNVVLNVVFNYFLKFSHRENIALSICNKGEIKLYPKLGYQISLNNFLLRKLLM